MLTSIEKYDDESIYLTGASGEDFLKTVAEKAKEGYTVVENTVMLNMYVKRCVMKKPEQVVLKAPVGLADSIPTEPVKQPVPTYSQAVIGSLKGDKNKLEQYGKELGVELKKSKSFENMVKDLEDYVAFPVKD